MTTEDKNQPPKSEHPGSMRSYAIGFLLSLIFTIIPYYLVRMQFGESKSLLLLILGFAVVQMFVQIFFFLHLGRGPKPFYNVVFFSATAGLIVLVVGASLLIMDNLYRNMSPSEVTTRLAQDENIAALGGKETGACQGNQANHEVVIGGGKVTPLLIKAKRCDTLSITSGDGIDREILFGPHDAPTSYGGLYELAVKSSRSKIITLNQTGEFSFHDHADPMVMGYFSVEP